MQMLPLPSGQNRARRVARRRRNAIFETVGRCLLLFLIIIIGFWILYSISLLLSNIAWHPFSSSRSSNNNDEDNYYQNRNNGNNDKYSGISNNSNQNQNGHIRVFGPSYRDEDYTMYNSNDIELYTRTQQREFLQNHGGKCWSGISGSEATIKSAAFVVEQFDNLPVVIGTELWKYCMFYVSTSPTLYWDTTQVQSLVSLQDLPNNQDIIVLVDTSTEGSISATLPIISSSSVSFIHPGFLQLIQPNRSPWVKTIISFLMETPADQITMPGLSHAAALYVQQQQMQNQQRLPASTNTEAASGSTLWKAKCLGEGKQHPLPFHCLLEGSFCCQVWNANANTKSKDVDGQDYDTDPVLMIKHPLMSLPLSAKMTYKDSLKTTKEDELSYPSQKQIFSTLDDPRYLATIKEIPHHPITDMISSATMLDTSNFLDILIQNNCLPNSRECHMCMKRSQGGCEYCIEECPCYCRVLCQIRPPPKPIVAVYKITPPTFSEDNSRRIPRIIHQTWYEPITKQKYPNMSRLIESWKTSGWKHIFYNDDDADSFIQQHLPKEVHQAYQSLLPGAFKADLFRYCVLLVRGGVYADMDVLLEANLDQVIHPDVGFVTPLDEPGSKIDHRSCLWNGFLAVAPGHPILVKTIEVVVNNIRNRFTSLDYDDMLCPNPVLSVSHSMDLLFVTGPCILGATMNKVLGKHPQSNFVAGEFHYENIPGSIVLLHQNKEDMGAHRFTLIVEEEKGHDAEKEKRIASYDNDNNTNNIIVCSTDLPSYDDRPKEVQHYSKTKEKSYVYGLTQLYKDNVAAGEEIRFIL